MSIKKARAIVRNALRAVGNAPSSGPRREQIAVRALRDTRRELVTTAVTVRRKRHRSMRRMFDTLAERER